MNPSQERGSHQERDVVPRLHENKAFCGFGTNTEPIAPPAPIAAHPRPVNRTTTPAPKNRFRGFSLALSYFVSRIAWWLGTICVRVLCLVLRTICRFTVFPWLDNCHDATACVMSSLPDATTGEKFCVNSL